MKRILKWIGIGVLSLFILLTVLAVLLAVFGEAEDESVASVSTPTLEPTQAPEGQPPTEKDKTWFALEESASQRLSDGIDLFDDGKYFAAQLEFRMIPVESSDPVVQSQGYYWLGRTHYELGSDGWAELGAYAAVVDTHYKAAVDNYSQALALEEQKPECTELRETGCKAATVLHDNYLWRGIANFAMGRISYLDVRRRQHIGYGRDKFGNPLKPNLDKAINDFNAAIENSKSSGEAYYERAKYWTLIGERDKAAQDLATARRESPGLFEGVREEATLSELMPSLHEPHRGFVCPVNGCDIVCVQGINDCP